MTTTDTARHQANECERGATAVPRTPATDPTTVDHGRVPSLLLRAGLAFVFAYAAIATLADPSIFAKYAPSLFERPGWTTVLLPAFVVYELLLAAAMLTRRHIFVASLLSALTLSAIIVANPDAFHVLFRNVPIVCAAVALALHTRSTPVVDPTTRVVDPRRGRPRCRLTAGRDKATKRGTALCHRRASEVRPNRRNLRTGAPGL